MVAGVEGIEQDRVDRLCRPEAQRVDALAAPANDGRVECGGDDALGRFPDVAGLIVMAADGFDAAAEADFIGAFLAFEFPGVTVCQPGFGQFDLPAVCHLLAEQAVDVANAIAIGRHINCCHGFHETGGKTAEATVAQRCVGLQACNDADVDAERGEGVGDLLHQTEIGDRVAHQTTNQELQRQIVNALGAGLIDIAGRFNPFVDDAVANDEDRRRQPVVRFGNLRVLADAVCQALDNFFGQDFGAGTARRGNGEIGLRQVIHTINSRHL